MKEQAITNALQNYREANSVAKDLLPCHPLRLGIALNLSVLYYEVINEDKQACELAEAALQDAISKIDELDEEDFVDARAVINLLKENLTIWKEPEVDIDKEDD
jgi:hypothetical protein